MFTDTPCIIEPWTCVLCCCSGGDGRHAGGDLPEGEDGDHRGERAQRVGAAPRAAVSARAIPAPRAPAPPRTPRTELVPI